MLHRCLFPDNFTFTFLINSCARLSALEQGEQLHCFAFKTGLISDLFLQNSLIHMYAKCDKIESVCKVFQGMSLDDKNVVSWNSIIDAFVKAGDVDSARRLFNEMPERNVVSWNSIIAGCAKESLFDEAFRLFLRLQLSGLVPDETTLMTIISVISNLGLLCLGKQIHGYVIRNEFSLDAGFGAALIDMYSKCGTIHSALKVFQDTQNKNNVGHWTSMIVGYAVNGFAEASLRLFSQMQACGVKPNYVTFVGVLNACSHGGLVEQGIRLFNLMKTYNIEPGIQHYGCLVDLLGRSNLVREAKMLIDYMPMEPGAVIWSTLLAACRKHGDIEIGEIAAQKLVELAPDYGGGYILLSNLYANSCKWMEFGRMRRMMGERGVEKVAGLSWIEVDGEIHEFLVGDKFHPRSMEIHRLLDAIQCKLRWEKAWGISEGRLLRTIEFPSIIDAIALDPVEKSFFAGSRDGKIYITALSVENTSSSSFGMHTTGALSEHSKAVSCLALNMDGNLLVSELVDGTIRVLDTKTLQIVCMLKHSKGPVNNVLLIRRSFFQNPQTAVNRQASRRHRSSFITTTSQQSSSAASEMQMERLRLDSKISLEMAHQWMKMYEDYRFCVDELVDGDQNKWM
ncbi:hypothetical protein IFM89_027828 [Coptis chinensis]|uniref:Pentatricopeptide repeat-containing protein n=1 Tax=Coptis chinensis TaxID=261450 RepID=A0A835MB14_9MAGN|nr:hypothetical protein IFM89_027828 [Coptis chinensis]